MRSGCLIVCAVLLISAAVKAEETAVYESFAGVKIGRVFLAPGDRARLDERRLQPPTSESAAKSDAGAAPEESRSLVSAGYIISSSGRARVWRDGDFVQSSQQDPDTMAFPGDVKVTRTVRADPISDKEDQPERDGEAQDDAD